MGAVHVSGAFFVRAVPFDPLTRVISTRDFEFSGGLSIWSHLVPDFKAEKQQHIE